MAKGGARPGSGRPKKSEARVTRAFRMLPATAANVEKLAAIEGMTASAWLDRAILEHVSTRLGWLTKMDASELRYRDPYVSEIDGRIRWDCTHCNEPGAAVQVAPGAWRCEGTLGCGARGLILGEIVIPPPTPEPKKRGRKPKVQAE